MHSIDSDSALVLVSDGGEFGQWAQACLRAPRRIINGPSGAIGGSIPYAVAVGFLRGDAGLREYDDAVVRNPEVRALARKVRYIVDAANPYPQRFTGHVRVRLRDGSIREVRQDHFRGGVEEPLTREALETKFRANCAFGGLAPAAADALLARVVQLPRAPAIEAGGLRGVAG